jgi:hypothetical protein
LRDLERKGTKLAELRRHDVYKTPRVPCGPIAGPKANRAASRNLNILPIIDLLSMP